MRGTKQTSCLLATGLVLGLLSTVAWGENTKTTKYPELKEIHQVDVNHWAEAFSNKEVVFPEIPQRVSELLKDNPTLSLASPAEAILTFSCHGPECYSIKAELHKGAKDGPIIWENVQTTFVVGVPYYKRSEKAVAKSFVKALLSDYRASQTASATPPAK